MSMTRDELLTKAEENIKEAESCAFSRNDAYWPLAAGHAAIAQACVLLAREMREEQESAYKTACFTIDMLLSGRDDLSDADMIKAIANVIEEVRPKR